jgi:hypothetical protein
MSEMVERVARALYERQAKLNHAEHSWETVAAMSKGIADEFRADARAAINEIGDILSKSHNSSLAYAGDELTLELNASSAE